MTNEDRALLEAFVVENEDLERLETLLAEFNIFEALGVCTRPRLRRWVGSVAKLPSRSGK